MRSLTENEIQKMLKLTAILLDIAGKLSTIFLQENVIMLFLNFQALVKNECQLEPHCLLGDNVLCQLTVFFLNHCASS